MASDRMLPPNHTWRGLSSLRSDVGEQGSRKTATPPTHWMDGGGEIKGVSQEKATPTLKANKGTAFVYLHGKKSRGGDSDPAVQRVDVWYVLGIMDAKHGIKPHDRQHKSEEHQRPVQQLPGEFILTPSQGNAVQHSSCGRDSRRVTDDITATM